VILTVLAASAAVYSWKLFGYLIPQAWISDRFRVFADRVTTVLLAALVGVQGFTAAGECSLDAKAVGLGVAAILLAVRVPYILVIVAAALTAAAIRATLGL
jgi:ABC-type transporter Mla maintaining outer membrane lipid asymmetry permease subunit MlaE